MSDGKMSCLVWTSVAFIDINNQLRYYPRFAPNTASNITAPYKVLTYLTASLGTAATPLPFALGATPTINVDLYAEAPDYNNRTTVAGTTNLFNGLNTADTYTYLQSALAPRNPIGLLRNPVRLRAPSVTSVAMSISISSSRSQAPSFHRLRGSTLAATMLVRRGHAVAFLSVSALITSQFGRFAGRQQGDSDLMAAGDAGLEYLYGQWTAAKRNQSAPPVYSLADLNSTAPAVRCRRHRLHRALRRPRPTKMGFPRPRTAGK